MPASHILTYAQTMSGGVEAALGRLLQGWLAPLRQVLTQDSQGTLRATLEAWCAHDGQVQTCAQALGIHRNTLRYRLERIAELSGLDLNRLDQRLQLSLGLGLLEPTETAQLNAR